LFQKYNMNEECKNCRHYKETLVNPGNGDCNCVTSKYYGDVIEENNKCEQFEIRIKSV
jgi:hypothetical protein